MFGNTTSPVALVTTGADSVPFDWLTSVTVAPGTTAPWLSLTVPDTVLVTPWAGAAPRPRSNSRQKVANTRRCDMTSLPLGGPAPPAGSDYRVNLSCCQYKFLLS